MTTTEAGPEPAATMADPLPPEPPGQPWRRSLSFRLAVVLTLALLPLGLIAVAQTLRLQSELDEIAHRDRMIRLNEFAEAEADDLDSARAAAGTLASVLAEVDENPDACAKLMRRFVLGSNGRFDYAGFRPVNGAAADDDGPLACASDDRAISHTTASGRGILTIRRVPGSPDDRSRPQVIVSLPVWSLSSDGESSGLAGSVTVILQRQSTGTPEPLAADRTNGEMHLFVVNALGGVINPGTSFRGDMPEAVPLPSHEVRARLIAEFDPAVGKPAQTGVRIAETDDQTIAAVPILSGAAFAMAIWPRNETTFTQAAALSAALFPLLMWLLSLGLVYWAVHHQLVRPVSILGAQMRRFGRRREFPKPAPEGSLPHELEAIEAEFLAVAETLIRDEAGLMDALHDKDVLLKEVHHRVKNNLQLISSIINLQTRRTKDQRVSNALASINRRVAGMSTVHQRLYQAAELGRVRADDLLRDVIGPLVELAPGGHAKRPDVKMDLAQVILYPDQALPFALLAVEAVTNALKYLGPDAAGNRWLHVTLAATGAHEGDTIRLTVSNSISPEGTETDNEEMDALGTGLGTQLITAFARQLDSEAEVDSGADTYAVSAEFPVQSFDPDR